jgi:hypothetical protein
MNHTPTVSVPHPAFCDRTLCTASENGVAHRAAGVTLGSGSEEDIITAYVTRGDSPHDYARHGELGTTYVALMLGVRQMWSRRWLLPDDTEDAGQIGVDLTELDAVRLGLHLQRHVDHAEHSPDRRHEMSILRTRDGVELRVYVARVAVGGQRLVLLEVRLNDTCWCTSPDYLMPGEGTVTVLLSVADGRALSRGLVEQAKLAGWSNDVQPVAEDDPSDDPLFAFHRYGRGGAAECP